jgi:hypothetical protein
VKIGVAMKREGSAGIRHVRMLQMLPMRSRCAKCVVVQFFLCFIRAADGGGVSV